MKTRWTKEQACEWYSKLGWLRGCNFIGSDCANRLDMWQSYKSEEKLATAERELALAQKIGFNLVRVWGSFDVYLAEPESYFEIFEKYVTLCDKYGQKIIVVLAHEEDLPRGEVFVPKAMGEQKYALGRHQGRFPLTPEEKAMTPYHYLEYPELKEKFLEMVGIEAKDDYTLVYTCTTAKAYFPTVATSACLYPISQALIDELGVDNFALVIGNEGQGVSENFKKAGKAVSLPMKSDMESLNAGISASVLMYVLMGKNI